jgi:hypothetical protein
MTLAFLGAGISKLRHGGLPWITSDNMAVMLELHRQPLGLWLAQHAWICHGMAAATIIWETLCPFALVGRRFRMILIPGLFLLQAGIDYSMGLNFRMFVVCYIFWVPWISLGTWLRGRWPLREAGRGRACHDRSDSQPTQ